MKKKLLIIITALCLILQIGITNAEDAVTIRITEKIPGVECNLIPVPADKIDAVGAPYYPNLYDCKVEKGVGQIVSMLGNIIKYFTYIALLSGVLFIVYNGILYTMGGADQSLKDDSKKRIIGTLIGLILLLLSGPILQLIAPWIYK